MSTLSSYLQDVDRYSSESRDTPTIRDFPSTMSREERSYSDRNKRPGTDNQRDWGSTFSTLFDKARDTDKYRSYGERSTPVFGDWSRGGGGQVLENLGVVYPQQQGPMYIPGVEGGKSGLGSAIGTLAGIGASFIPGIGPGLSRALPAIGGSVGSFF